MSDQLYLTAREASKHYKVTQPHLRKLAREGKIPVVKTIGGHYRYVISDTKQEDKPEHKECFIYARVSSKKQSSDLERQSNRLQSNFKNYTLITDIGSGINFKRKGFTQILELLFQRKVKKVVVTHGDRFSRIGFEFFQWLFEQFDATLEVMFKSTKPNPTEELATNLMEIITVYTSRYYGTRRHQNLKDQDISESESEDSL
jgi:excisionase family DNA binding protein